MANSPSLIKYDQTPTVNFFLCRQCLTHIALTQEFVFRDIMVDKGIFNDVVNVEIAKQANYRMENNNTVADVNCKGCNGHLGKKFVEVESSTILVKQGRFLLDLNKLQMWEGTQMLNADTNEPSEHV